MQRFPRNPPNNSSQTTGSSNKPLSSITLKQQWILFIRKKTLLSTAPWVTKNSLSQSSPSGRHSEHAIPTAIAPASDLRDERAAAKAMSRSRSVSFKNPFIPCKKRSLSSNQKLETDSPRKTSYESPRKPRQKKPSDTKHI